MMGMKSENYSFYDVIDVDTMKELLLANEEEFPYEIAVRYKKKSRIIDITYSQLKRQCDCLGTALHTKGIKNCTVGILGNSSYEWFLSYITILCGSCTALPLDKSLQPDELEEVIKETDCKVVIYDSVYIDTINKLKEKLPLEFFIKMNELENYIEEGRKLLDRGKTDFIYYNVKKDSIASIMYTSGTCSKSKSVMLTQENILSDAAATARLVFLGEMTLVYMPFHSAYSIMAGIIVPLIQRTIIFIDPNQKNFIKNLKDFQPESTSVVPCDIEYLRTVIWDELKKEDKVSYIKIKIKLTLFLMSHGINLSKIFFKNVQAIFGENLKYIICGGALLDEEYVNEFRAFGIEILNGYGLTECSPVISVNRNKFNRPGSVGIVVPGCNLTVSEEGEILIKGSMVMKGYYKDVEHSEESFKNKWFKTGDIGYMDSDGFLYIVGRMKNIIVLSNGETVSPEELECKLKKLEGIKDCSIYNMGGEINAEIYPDYDFLEAHNITDAGKFIRGEIKKFNKTIAKYKWIRRVKIRNDEFPKESQSKLSRFNIINMS